MERERQSLPIRGINRAESDDTVADGACEDICNLRYRAGVFETVCEPQLLYPLADNDGYEIVHRVQTMAPGEYVVRKGHALYCASLTDGAVNLRQEIGTLPAGASDLRYSHFGNVLYVTYYVDGVLGEKVYRYKEGEFHSADMSALGRPILTVEGEPKSATSEKIPDYDTPFPTVLLSRIRFEPDPADSGKDSSIVVEDSYFYNTGVDTLHADGYITGTAYIFAAYRLFDGSIVKPSELCVVSGDKNVNNPSLYKVKESDHTYKYYGSVGGISPKITVSVPAETVSVLGDLIRDVVIFSTRNVMTYRYDEAHKKFDDYEHGIKQLANHVWLSYLSVVWNKDELEEHLGPFYQIAELDVRNGETSLTLTYKDHYAQVVNQPVYEADFLNNNAISRGKYEYNDRLHLYDIRYRLTPECSPFLSLDSPLFGDSEALSNYEFCEDPNVAIGVDYRLTVEGETRYVQVVAPYRGYWVNKREIQKYNYPTGDEAPPLSVDVFYFDPITGLHYDFDSASELGSNERNFLGSIVNDLHHNAMPSWFFSRLISYPDYRAERAVFWIRYQDKVIASWEQELTSSPAQNMAWAIMRKTGSSSFGLSIYDYVYQEFESGAVVGAGYDFVRNCAIEGHYDFSKLPDTGYIPVSGDSVNAQIVSQNKVWVSESSNPFDFRTSHIYTIGTQGEQIREMIATSERMTEVAYGYHPLLAFTDRAVYALESGEGEVLYARNIPVLSQTILEGTNAAEGSGVVFFLSATGVMAFVRGESSSLQTVSEALKRYAGLHPADGALLDFDDYIRAARLLFNRKESELIVYNPAHEYADVYSLAGQYWTRRTWNGAVEPYFNELATVSGVASLSEEDTERPVSECRLITRPLKFGSFECKRLETLVARMRWGAGRSFRLEVEGSDDAIRWFSLRSERNRSMIRRTPSSFRYHRFRLVGSGADYLAITHFDVEFYNRFIHRLR